MLRLADKWLWDFWLVRRNDERHVFYLQAPKSLGNAGLRHHHATIGHAVTRDGLQWRVLPDAVHPGPPGSWDDLATWTGSALGHEGRWYMLYTGINREEAGLVQRVGLAVSEDLVHWQKYAGNPVLEADSRWYEVLGQGRWRDESWRDPWLFRGQEDGQYHVLLTARSRFGEPDGAGVIGHARSPDLLDWEVMAPVTEPGEFAQVEVPQLVETDTGYLVLFSCHSEDHSRKRLERLGVPGRGGTFTMSAPDLGGPWLTGDVPIETPDDQAFGASYAGKLVEGDAGQWEFMAFRGEDDQRFLGELIGPFPVKWSPDGSFLVSPSSLSESGAARLEPYRDDVG